VEVLSTVVVEESDEDSIVVNEGHVDERVGELLITH